jgi:ABC transport system ATP-binding/permease protein
VCDVTYALMGDGSCVLLPGGVEQYLEARRAREATSPPSVAAGDTSAKASAATEARQAKKTLARVEQQLSKVDDRIAKLHAQMAEAASDYAKLSGLQRDLDRLGAEKDDLELAWLEAAEQAG